MAVDSRAVEQRSRLTVADVEAAIGFDSNDLDDPTVVNYWLMSAKQSADQYMNREFARYDKIPEPVEQGVIAYVREMLYAYLESIAIGDGIGDDGDGAMVGVRSIKVGDQSITYMSSAERVGGSGTHEFAGYGAAITAAKEYWSQYRYHPLL